MPGGIIKPDGRPTQAPGVGADAKRHDLEGTPGLHDSSLQQGDVQMLEEGQRSMKQVQPQASSGVSAQPQARPAPNVEVPDAIDFVGGRMGGTLDAQSIGRNPPKRFDVERWRPLMQELARDPGTSGALTTAMISQIHNLNTQPSTVGVDIMDMNAIEDAAWESIQ